MTVDGVKPAGHDEAERRRQRLLHPSARRDQAGTILVGELSEDCGEMVEFSGDESERLPELQHAAGVNNVSGLNSKQRAITQAFRRSPWLLPIVSGRMLFLLRNSNRGIARLSLWSAPPTP